MIGTGYAFLDGRKVTYQAADEYMRGVMGAAEPRQRVTVYLSSDGRHLTTWTGGELGYVTGWGKLHANSVERRYFTARGQGHTWHGIGAAGMYAILTRSVKS